MVKGATKHCCWGRCNSDSRYPDRLQENVFFIRFPKPGKFKENMQLAKRKKEEEKTEKCKIWIHACGRKGFENISHVKKDTYICSLHFVGGNGPTEINPNPLIATWSENKIKKKSAEKRKLPMIREAMKKKPITSTDVDNLELIEEECDDDGVEAEETNKAVDKETQTTYHNYVLAAKLETMIMRKQNLQSSAVKQTLKPNTGILSKIEGPTSPGVILSNSEKCKYFVGLYPDEFQILFDFLGPAKLNLVYWKDRNKASTTTSICSEQAKDELFLTLLRLRRGFNITTISYMYDISISSISNITITWINFLYHHFKDHQFLMFPKREEIQHNLPSAFKKFKNIRASIDCTEFFCQSPRDYGQQGNMYSSYKHHTTMKCMIAVNPHGAACFVSDVFEGSMDDVRIFKESGILDFVNPGDSFLVDKGFTIQHLLLPKQAKIFIPPFLGKRRQFTKEEVLMTKRIAKARIHVERFNERLKKFRILSNDISLNLIPIISQIVFVCCCLVNFQPCLCE